MSIISSACAVLSAIGAVVFSFWMIKQIFSGNQT